MPYISQDKRKLLNNDLTLIINRILSDSTICAGDLNYIFSIICKAYWTKNKKYQTINDIVGALEGAKLEFTRRITNGYEDLKISENGDIYGE